MRIKYVGDHDEVEMPSLQLACKRGESIEVDDDTGLAMIEQAVWEVDGSLSKFKAEESTPVKAKKEGDN